MNTTADAENETPKKKKKNKKNKGEKVEAAAAETTENTAESPNKIKMKSKVAENEVEANGDVSLEEAVPAVMSERKKKKNKDV